MVFTLASRETGGQIKPVMNLNVSSTRLNFNAFNAYSTVAIEASYKQVHVDHRITVLRSAAVSSVDVVNALRGGIVTVEGQEIGFTGRPCDRARSTRTRTRA